MKHKKIKIITGLFVFSFLMMTLVANPQISMYMADLLNPEVTGADEDAIYMPSYTAEAGTSGLMEVKAKTSVPAFDSLSFLMSFTPSDALTFADDPLVLDEDTLLNAPTSQVVELKEAGVLEVTLVLPEPVTIDGPVPADVLTHETLFKLDAQVADVDGPVVLNFTDVAFANGDQALEEVVSIPPSLLTLEPAGDQQPVVTDDFNAVSVTSVNPDTVSNQSNKMVAISGSNLMSVDQVKAGSNTLSIINQATDSLLVQVPAGLNPNTYDLVLLDDQDTAKIFEGMLTVTADASDEGLSQNADAPSVNLDRSYTSPVAVENDGETPFVLYAFVEDPQNDIESVVVDLSAIGQVGQSSAALGQAETLTLQSATCPTASKQIVCMQASVEEVSGQWFVLPNIYANPSTPASQTPYLIQVLTKDAEGNTSMDAIPVYVGNPGDVEPAKVLAAVSTGPNTVEVMFNRALDSASLATNGEDFSIQSALDEFDQLAVSGASLNAEGNLVTLNTLNQTPNKAYELTLTGELQDSFGKTVSFSAPLTFEGYQLLEKSPQIDYLTATSSNTVEVEFEHDLKLSLLGEAQISIFKAGNEAQTVVVNAVTVLDGNQLELQTASLVAGERYRLSIDNLASYDGTLTTTSLNRGFKGARFAAGQHGAAAQQADLNGDLRVDFADFTIFSFYYGSDFRTGATDATPTASSSESTSFETPEIADQPDALVETTSPINN